MVRRAAYGMGARMTRCSSSQTLNATVVQAEKDKKPVQAPGLPASVTDRSAFVTTDCIGA